MAVVTQETLSLLREAEAALDNYQLPAKVFADEEIYRLEQEKLFSRAWIFLGHASEIPQPGDYVLRYIGDTNQVIVVRDELGEIRAFLNMCRHRGMAVCRSEAGNTSHFRCPYHGWTYSNQGKLVGVPALEEAYRNNLDFEANSLLPVPQLAVYRDWIFGTMDEGAPPLEEFLGDMTWYIDLLSMRSKEGLEVVGRPQRWIMDADWKTGADNFIGDSYHTLMTHRSAVLLGLAPPDPKFAMYGEAIHIPGKGHGLGVIGHPPGIPLPGFWCYPEPIVKSLMENYPTPEHIEVAKRTDFLHGTIFPNTSILNVCLAPDHKRAMQLVPFFTIRQWRPIAPGKMEVWSWFLVEKDAPEDFKELSRKVYERTFGPGGVFEQDDAENWRSVTRAAEGPYARKNMLNYELAKDIPPDPDWPGPGVAYPIDYCEANQRNWWRTWLSYLLS